MSNNPEKPYKLLFILPKLGQGGSETALLNVLAAFKHYGHQVELIVIRDCVGIKPPTEIKVHYLFKESKLFGRSGSKFLRELALKRMIINLSNQRGGFDLILSNYLTRYTFVEKHYPNQVYYYIHFDYQFLLARNYKNSKKAGDKIKKKLYGYCHRKNIIAVSAGALKTIINIIMAEPRQAKVIYNMFDITILQKKALAKIPTIPQEPYIIHIARFDLQQKRQDLLFAAFQQVSTNYKLVLLTEYSTALQHLIQQYGLTGRVLVAGFQNNPYPWIKQAKLSVLCSDYEGFGNVLVESLICGAPIMSTNCPSGPSEIMQGPLSKYLVPCNNPTALAARINACLTAPPNINFQPIIDEFDIAHIFPQYLQLIHNSTR